MVIRGLRTNPDLKDQFSRKQEADRLFDIRNSLISPLMRQPPLGDALYRILRVGVSLQISQDFARDLHSLGFRRFRTHRGCLSDLHG